MGPGVRLTSVSSAGIPGSETVGCSKAATPAGARDERREGVALVRLDEAPRGEAGREAVAEGHVDVEEVWARAAEASAARARAASAGVKRWRIVILPLSETIPEGEPQREGLARVGAVVVVALDAFGRAFLRS